MSKSKYKQRYILIRANFKYPNDFSVQICVKNIHCQGKYLLFVNEIIISLRILEADDDDAFVPIKCYECGGDKGKCNDAEDLGVEKVCPKETKTCVIARDESGKH